MRGNARVILNATVPLGSVAYMRYLSASHRRPEYYHIESTLFVAPLPAESGAVKNTFGGKRISYAYHGPWEQYITGRHAVLLTQDLEANYNARNSSTRIIHSHEPQHTHNIGHEKNVTRRQTFLSQHIVTVRSEA